MRRITLLFPKIIILLTIVAAVGCAADALRLASPDVGAQPLSGVSLLCRVRISGSALKRHGVFGLRRRSVSVVRRLNARKMEHPEDFVPIIAFGHRSKHHVHHGKRPGGSISSRLKLFLFRGQHSTDDMGNQWALLRRRQHACRECHQGCLLPHHGGPQQHQGEGGSQLSCHRLLVRRRPVARNIHFGVALWRPPPHLHEHRRHA